MKVSDCIGCKAFPCEDVLQQDYQIPDVEIDPRQVSIVLVSEAAPANRADYYYAAGNPLFEQTTVAAFNEAGCGVSSIRDILGLGVYLTTAVKCGKLGYGLQTSTVEECSHILENELRLFPNARVLLLMGDVAIKAVNFIARRAGEKRVIPAGSTYKLRGPEYTFRGMRVFPSYLQAGSSFFIEKSKRRMIGEDIAAALQLIG